MYAGLRRVEGSLRGCTCQKNADAIAYATFLGPHVEKPAACGSARAYAIWPTPKINNCLREEPTPSYAVPFYLDFMISKRKMLRWVFKPVSLSKKTTHCLQFYNAHQFDSISHTPPSCTPFGPESSAQGFKPRMHCTQDI